MNVDAVVAGSRLGFRRPCPCPMAATLARPPCRIPVPHTRAPCPCPIPVPHARPLCPSSMPNTCAPHCVPFIRAHFVLPVVAPLWRSLAGSARLPPSQQQWMLVGLNLLRLLSQNRIAEFHTEIELLPTAALEHPLIKHPILVEQWLMEGAYNKVRACKGRGSKAAGGPARRLMPRRGCPRPQVIKGRAFLPVPEYGPFTDTLISTMRYARASP